MNRRDFLVQALGMSAAALLAGCSDNKSGKSNTAAGSVVGGSSTTTSTTSTTTTAAPSRPDFISKAQATNKIAITFHAEGDPILVDRMLSKLRDLDVSATLFVVGSWLEQHSVYARRFLDGGHELANHTYSHPTLSTKGVAEVSNEITKCRDVLQRLAGTPGAWFRPSGTDNGIDRPNATIMQEARRAGYLTVLGYDVDPFDYRDPGTSAVADRVRSGVGSGSIISLHFGHQGTIDAMDAIVSNLRSRHLQPVTVSDMLA